ncbi:MAG: response regulator [Rhodocyclaceae bacterium]|nr:MAG: response regulator [Rhodocyclaceae bacterium]
MSHFFSEFSRGDNGNPYKSLRFLVVEDQAAARQTLRMCIQSMGGFSVDMAQSHGEAMSRLRNRMPDVIICDYILGNSRTGQQLLEELRREGELPHDVVFIMVTAERGYEQVISAVELVPDDYIIKPFAPELLRTRLEKVIRKKQVFSRYYLHRNSADWDGALEELDRLAQSPAAAHHRYDVMRQRADTLMRAERHGDAAEAYEAILEEHPFPWAKAGYARVLQRSNRLAEARALVDSVIAQVPRYFEAYDLKAEICTEMGEHGEAVAALQTASALTPHNWSRKRALAVAASRNGDVATVARVMAEVMAQGDLAGEGLEAVVEMTRCAVEVRNHALAAQLLAAIKPEQLDKAGEEIRLSLECLTVLAEGSAGGPRFDRIRARLVKMQLFSVDGAIDVVRAALLHADRQLANMTAAKVLAGPEARRSFKALLAVYCQHGLEEGFRDLQREVASQRLMSRTRH